MVYLGYAGVFLQKRNRVTVSQHVIPYNKSIRFGEETMQMPSKRIVHVDQHRCVACGVCELTCPKQAIKVWRGCYAAVETERCVGCGLCVAACPAGCLVRKERGSA